MSTTHFEKVTDVLESEEQQAVQALLDDSETVFWVDWREEDESIANYCEGILQTGSLKAELIDVDTDEGFELHLYYNSRDIKVPLTFSPQDRHITLCSLNEVLQPDFEVRFVTASNGSDTLAFVPLPVSTWQELEEGYGDRIQKHFYRISPKPNLFTDPLPF